MLDPAPHPAWHIRDRRHELRSISRLLVLVTFLGSITFAAVPASAAEKSGADPAIAAALKRIANRTHTPADVTLIKSHPEIAARVGDPDRPPTVKVTSTRSAGGPAANAINDLTCDWFTVEITARTFLGFVHWQWRHVIEVCWDGVVVTQWRNRWDTLSYSDSTAYAGPLIADGRSELPATPATSFYQRRIDICVPYFPCYASSNPWSEINLNGDGTWWWHWGVA
jgi:hypothetical protein